MASFNKFQPFVENLFEGKFNFTSDATCTITVALCAAANAPVATYGVLGDLTEILYTNLGSRVVTITSSSQTSGTYKLVLADKDLTASGGAVAAFRYIVLYDDDATSDELIGYFDYGSDLTLSDGDTLTLDFDATDGVLQAS